jgi:hypothetical protein
VDIARSSVPTVASFQLPSSLIHQQPLIVSHALSVVETCSLLFHLYDLAYQSLYHIQVSSSMSRRSSLSSGPPNLGVPDNIRQRAPPQPDPEPAAPPIIILAQSGNKRTVKPRPQYQVPAPAGQGLGPRSPTSSLPQRQTSRYNLRDRPSKPTFVSTPNKPTPQPEPHPAPPVIILSNEQPQPRLPQQPRPSSPTTPLPQAPPPQEPAPHNPLKRTRSTMGSKVSKVRERAQDGKLQPSQEQLDKEQMKEPSNYYTHRSKSMRRKAGKEASSDGAGGAVGGSAGAGGLM